MKIVKILPDSLGKEIGFQPGDRLIKINGKRVQDEIDYIFRITEQKLILDIEINGQLQQVEIEKEYDDDLGIEFEEMKIRSCANDCVFCFVDQNPSGMREGMYFRDGDYRMSYLHGHYITMTNMGQNELERIVEQCLSPLYISVHVTDTELRQKLFLYKKDDRLLEKLKFLTEHGIELHTQIVLMPGINDGDYLLKTLSDIYTFYPKLKTCTIVPVGLTGHRKGLMKISTVSNKYAKDLLGQLSHMKNQYPGESSPFILFSDEWYILADEPFPSLLEYGGIDLIENGVGQVRDFLNQFEIESNKFPLELAEETSITIITGILIYDIFQDIVIPALNQIKKMNASLIPIKNNFYGNSVTVTGLLAGKDIVSQLSSKPLGDAVWMSHRILNDEGFKTLDDMTLEEMSHSLDCPVRVGKDSFLALVEGLNNG